MENQSKDSLKSETKPQPTYNSKKKVLIVDDEITLGQMLQDILEAYDFETAFAETSDAALKLMPEFRPAVALIDFRLGSITGIEVAQLLKKIDEDLPVILMTAYPSLDLAVKAIQSDIYDFLSKPVDKTYLLRSITKAIEKRSLSEENKKLIVSLKESNVKLEQLNRMKSKFLSIVTHDLRTPLTSIRGYSEMLQTTGSLSAENKNKCFSAIDKSVERMNSLINNLLDMVSIEAGKLRVEKAPMDYVALCREVKETLATVAQTRGAALQWDLPAQTIPVIGDSNRLVQVLTNLISNAFKHIPERGKISVKISLKETASAPNLALNSAAPALNNQKTAATREIILTEVIDNGEGISQEDQTRIFEQFYQVESSPSRREGLGLGLAISKEIIHSHGGAIGVHSDGLGKGCRFWFTIPVEKR